MAWQELAAAAAEAAAGGGSGAGKAAAGAAVDPLSAALLYRAPKVDDKVVWFRLTLSKPVLKAPMVTTLETIIL